MQSIFNETLGASTIRKELEVREEASFGLKPVVQEIADESHARSTL